jgi:hypothetical protein
LNRNLKCKLLKNLHVLEIKKILLKSKSLQLR